VQTSQKIGDRKSGLLFSTSTGKPLSQSNILRRWLHPILKQLNWKHLDSGRTAELLWKWLQLLDSRQ
jgi:hypothetical protein